jgi:P27 family predicted phage terminase small subunit
MKPGPRPKASILRLIQGSVHTERLKADRPKIAGPPEVPPGSALSPEEREIWNWLIRTVYLPGCHGASDGAAFLRVTRLLARANEVDAKIRAQGLVMKSPRTGKPEVQPYVRISRDVWMQLNSALDAIGMTPGARVRLSGPYAKGPADSGTWDDIDDSGR